MSSAIQHNKLTAVVRDNDSAARALAVHGLIARFESKLDGIMDYASFEYECLAGSASFTTGEPESHCCSYHLTAAELSLGEIKLSRATPFRESELQLLEACLSDLCLLLPGIIDPDSAVLPLIR